MIAVNTCVLKTVSIKQSGDRHMVDTPKLSPLRVYSLAAAVGFLLLLLLLSL